MKGTEQVVDAHESQEVDGEDGCAEVDSRDAGVDVDDGVIVVNEMVDFVARNAWKVLSWGQ